MTATEVSSRPKSAAAPTSMWELAIYVGIGVSVFLIALLDLTTRVGLAVWLFYVIPVCLSLWLRRPHIPALVALGCTLLLMLNYLDPEASLSRNITDINRLLGITTLWIIGITGYFFIRNRNQLRQESALRNSQTILSVQMLGEQRVEELGQAILNFFISHLQAACGAVYIRDRTGYRLVAQQGAAADGAPKTFTVEDGLLGQAVRTRQTIIMHELPEGYLTMASALGQGSPRHLVILPALADTVCTGVIELGFLDRFEDAEMQLLGRLAEPIGNALQSAIYRERLQGLLEETQQQAEELQAQSEELRVSNEELEEQSRALQESQSRLEQQQAELEQTNTQLEDQTHQLEVQRDSLKRIQASLELRTRELQQASQYKSDFLANMSHELRTPLNSTLILAKLLADNPDENLTEEQVRHARTIESSGNDLLNLINDILDLSKIEAGHTEILPEKLPLPTLVENLQAVFTPVANEKGLELSTSVSPACPTSIFTDGLRLEQILKNLLSNALKFTETGSVELAISCSDTEISFAVRDTGIGISAEQQEVIFAAFHQADGQTNRKYGGTGLGLSISRELARLLGGRISLKSEPGAGSVFTLTIPQHYDPALVAERPQTSAASAPTAARAPEPAPLPAPRREQPATEVAEEDSSDDRHSLIGRQRILLVVEDDSTFAGILYDLARSKNFQCLIASTADEALQLASRYMPSAVILDVGLPDHSGLSVLDRLKQDSRTRHIPVHVISGEDYSQTAYSLGAVGYMLKPVKHDDLLQTLQQLEQRMVQRMRHILIVEDNQVQRESIGKLLSSHDVVTTGVGTVADCLEQLSRNTYDCMVLDLSLPDASGYALLETLSQEEGYSFPPVIVYTGRDLSAEEEHLLRRYSRSIIIKGAKSPERLLDEVTLFLHQVVSELPPEQQKMLQKSRNRDSILEGRSIMIVEDDVRNVYSLTNILEPRGARVVVARNGQEALDMLAASQTPDGQTVDLVLMDVMMPVMDGITATRSIRRNPQWKKLPIIMLTAKAMRDDQERCIEAGANDYMSKPLDVEKLLSLVRVWMPR